MKENAPALPAKDHRGIDANPMQILIELIEIINSYSVFARGEVQNG